ncbi:ABC transporter ATP-binding protein [Listeria seeligeri]|uniref:ABC transporter ATP-binding protein n=1 Tax=Listeria seeligeri TaxID=1640 RepID=A0A7X0X250_LISSE|nr:ABC transporter ATP-binding protein [Listeria seeligeri]MBC1485801.1 ABC transporter ATP-binding protein [Listeria seeligeri]MBC2071584.1 ABC transporter ATP-binding protein [Listeria seeligeri]MBC2088696.1 ABC transporter ATP-binding protein [Listeria seeligeri]MBF2355672.1 ABC transporter ATP-binding protein [Listeria seeligeri]MBF2592259.1 ABC transporter ATP-binding protein [Listeria seeligeri]
MKPALELKNISFSRKRDFQMSDINAAIPEGKITTLIGPNGSGKSTMLRLMMRLLTPDSGEVLLGEKNITDISAKELAKKMTMLAQAPEGLVDVIVHDLVAYGRLPYRSFLSTLQDEDEAVIKWAIKVCNLENLAYRPLHSLSGGERQRAWLAMALAQKTPILLLDEPTTYLDIAHQLELLDLLVHLNKEYNLTIVLVLHDLNQAAIYSDYVFVCENGRLVKSGTPKEVFTIDLLKNVFHITADITEKNGKQHIHPLASTRFEY